MVYRGKKGGKGYLPYNGRTATGGKREYLLTYKYPTRLNFFTLV